MDDSLMSYIKNAIMILFATSLVIFAFALMFTGKNQETKKCDSPIVKFYFEDGKSEYYTANLGTIVIDPGHGGIDPGKVSDDGVEEKKINLKIAYYLKELFERDGYRVVLTRTDDSDVCTGKYSKVEDLANRVDIIQDSESLCTISIHQNSYSSPDVHGPQVFYFKGNDDSKMLAESIQNELNDSDFSAGRIAKENKDYYLFTHTDATVVIVECGFLSNPSDVSKLILDENQKRIAQIIYKGAKKCTKNLQND